MGNRLGLLAVLCTFAVAPAAVLAEAQAESNWSMTDSPEFVTLLDQLVAEARQTQAVQSLGDVPQKSLWFGMWGSDANSFPWSSLAWDGVTDDQINQYGGSNTAFLYPVGKFFCQEGQESGRCTIMSDYQNRWNQAVPQMTQLLSQGKIIGFFAGDERICKNQAAGPTNTIVDTIRATFPRGKAIIYLNECGSTWPDHSMPENADWVSVDRYRSSSSEDYVSEVKKLYDEGVFKKLHSNQKVLLLPGVGHPRDNTEICDDSCTAKIELQDAKDFVKWAHSDSRVIGIAPYAWMRDGHVEKGLNQLSDNDALKSYYENLGRSTQ